MTNGRTTPEAGPPRLREELLRQRYLRKDAMGNVTETPQEMFHRVAFAVAMMESQDHRRPNHVRRLARQFERVMSHGIFLPNSPTLMNAGGSNMCSACFVLPVDDSIESIFDAVKRAALVQKAGGGTGFAFDRLRPTGDLVASSGGETSGPISFMKVFSEATGAIQQGAFRRGANMAMMSVEHPDILKFIAAKAKPGEFENFNLSVKVTDDFMRALVDRPNEPHMVTNPRTKKKYLIPRDIDLADYSLDDLVEVGYVGFPCFTIGEVWWMIVRGAHATGEPGVCFIDRVNRENPTPRLGPIEATNPCGEQPLLPNEACNLGSINLAKFVVPETWDFRWEALKRTIHLAVRFLDNVVGLTQYPTREIALRSLRNRKIGLGVMGFADALVLRGMRYDSPQGLAFATQVGEFVQKHAHEASARLAKERGCFSGWEQSIWGKREQPMRNAAVTTIAPTGSISLIAECSSGIEPIFSLACKRRALDGHEFTEIHPPLEGLGERQGWLTADVREALMEGTPPTEIPGIPKDLAETLVTAHEVPAEWHVKMQAVFQANVDNAVSKTVNLPAAATLDDVDGVFRLAFESGCKGITVYRDGSRSGQTLSSSAADGELHDEAQPNSSPRPRARVTTGQTSKFRMGCGTLFVTVNRDEDGLCEVFANLGKAGGCPSQSEATCRAVSTALRSGVDPKELVEQLRGIRCPSTARAKGNGSGITVQSCPDAIACAIEEAIGENLPAQDESSPGLLCPDCQQPLNREAGCFVCQACGYSKCG